VKRRHTPLAGHHRQRNSRRRIRYAVVGLRHIAQNAILPAFEHATGNSELAALISDDVKTPPH
jgi:hypothetical protein